MPIEKEEIKITDPEKIVPNDKMDIDLPGYAWDLLPYKSNPLDLYRAPMWHAEYDFEKEHLMQVCKRVLDASLDVIFV